MEDHDDQVNRFLTRLEENGVTLNPEKCRFAKQEVEFLGHFISEDGIQPGRHKFDAITQFRRPENLTELRRFMGMGPATLEIQSIASPGS